MEGTITYQNGFFSIRTKGRAEEIYALQATKKPVQIDYCIAPCKLKIPTLEGEMIAESGDIVIRGVAGELYPCKPGIFLATYDTLSAPVK